MKYFIAQLVLILMILPLQTYAQSMTEKDFIQSMFDYTNQQNNLTKRISIQAKNKDLAQGAKLTCQLRGINYKKDKIIKSHPQYHKLLNPQFFIHNDGIIKQTEETLSYTSRLGYSCSKPRL